MWVSKIRIKGDGALIAGLCKKHNVSASGYPLSTVRNGDDILVSVLMFVFGENENKVKFFNEFKDNPRVVNAELKGHCIIGQIRESLVFSSMYNYNVIHIEPVKASEDGSELWTVASWDKKELMEFSNLMEREYDSVLLKMKQEDVSNVSILTIHPELTDSQRGAMELALKNGYYNVPRGIGLEELAEMMGISYSTFQVHLRKAEKKLLPFFFEKSF